MDNRYHDYFLAHQASQSHDPELRLLGQRTIQMLNDETPKIKAMREALVEATRKGDKDKIKDIHWEVNKHPTQYKNQLANNKLKKGGETADHDNYNV